MGGGRDKTVFAAASSPSGIEPLPFLYKETLELVHFLLSFASVITLVIQAGDQSCFKVCLTY